MTNSMACYLSKCRYCWS